MCCVALPSHIVAFLVVRERPPLCSPTRKNGPVVDSVKKCAQIRPHAQRKIPIGRISGDEIRQATKIAEAAAEQLRRDLAKTNAELEGINKLKGQLQQMRDDLERKGEEIKNLTHEKASCIKESQECQGQLVVLRRVCVFVVVVVCVRVCVNTGSQAATCPDHTLNM
jgi:TolA-binding protein